MVRGRKRSSPGDLIYLSTRKLYGCAAQLGVETEVALPDLSFERGVEGRLSLPPVAVSAGATRAGGYTDPGWEEQVLHDHLARVVARLGELPSLEDAAAVREGGWFRFHRPLRFGVGHADANPSIKALVAVDSTQVPRGSPVPGLLMNGSIAHVRDPYATDELRAAPGCRSGSGSDRLFIWLEEMRLAWEEEPEASLRSIFARTGSPAKDGTTAWEMYGAFSESPDIAAHMAEPLMHEMTCEGVGQASFVATTEEITLVMGSPLYIRRRPPEDPYGHGGGLLSRLLRR